MQISQFEWSPPVTCLLRRLRAHATPLLLRLLLRPRATAATAVTIALLAAVVAAMTTDPPRATLLRAVVAVEATGRLSL